MPVCEMTVGACEHVNEDGGIWVCVFIKAEISRPSRGACLFFGLEIFRFCSSKAVQDPCSVNFAKL